MSQGTCILMQTFENVSCKQQLLHVREHAACDLAIDGQASSIGVDYYRTVQLGD